MIRFALVAVLVACSVPDVDYTGKACPCPDGWVCAADQTCRRAATPLDGPIGDASGDAIFDVLPATSCLSNPMQTLTYSTATFSDFATKWKTGGGTWSVMQGILHQTDATTDLAYAYQTNTVYSNVRVVATMRQENGATGGAIELALRVQAQTASMYHCNWEPNDGNFLIQRTDNGIANNGLVATSVSTIGLDPKGLYTLEAQVNGSTIECCIDGIPGAHLMTADLLYGSGYPGVKTYLMNAVVPSFAVYQ